MSEKVKAYSDQAFTTSPSTDGGYNRIDQLADVGLPNTPFEMREALLQRPYYLGREKRFMPDAAKYPNIRKVMEDGVRLKPQFVSTAPAIPAEGPMQVEEKQTPEYPEVEKLLKEEG